MKKNRNLISEHLLTAIIILLLVTVAGCSNSESEDNQKAEQKFTISDDKTKITFPENYEGLKRISAVPVYSSTISASVIAPSRVVATISTDAANKGKMVLFDTPEMTSLYSQYRQSRINVELTRKNLERVKDMFELNAATGKDLSQAESDAANAQTSLSEMEGRFRVSGFDAKEIDNTPPGMLWIISDVTEVQLREVTKGEDVDIVFNSFPEKKFNGKAVSIGDAIDPVTRTVKVRVLMKAPSLNILPGMFARVDYGDPQSGVIQIPASSVFTVEGKDYVFLQTAKNEFIKKQVLLSNQINSNVIVIKGIENGDNVVVEGAILLKGLCYQY